MGAGFAASALALISCSSSTASAPTTVAPSVAPSSTPVVTPTSAVAPPATSVATSVAPSTTSAIDGAKHLADALDKLGTSYHFTTTASVAETVTITAEGDRVGDGTRLTLTGSSGVVDYVITAKGSWAKPENGTWAALDAPPAGTDPIGALANPVSVKVASVSGGVVLLTVAVPPTALGLTGTEPALLDVEVTDGILHRVTYRTPAGSATAEVVAVIGPVKDASPVVAPV
jgi:hypothetical protein